MLVQTTGAMDPYGMSQEEFAMYEKCHQGQYMQAFDPMAMSFRENQHRMQLNSRQSKKPKPPIESFQNYVAIVHDPYTGKIVLRSSSTMRSCRQAILGGEATAKFREYMKMPGADNGRCPLLEIQLEQPQIGKESSHRSRKKRKGSDDVDVSDSSELAHKEEIPTKQEDEDPEDDDSRYLCYRADDKEDWEKWFNDAFRAVQQVSCRVIAKEWIKTIHPKKQSTHPYNGKNTRTGEPGDPNSTKPPYWPKDVIHKEPDHINKEARTKLLVHLLMNTPHQEMSVSGDSRSTREISAEILRESLEQKKLERGMTELRKKSAIIDQIIEVRQYLEQFEDGGIDGETIITAVNYSDFNRGSKNDEEDDDEADENDEADSADPDDADEGIAEDRGQPPRDTKPVNNKSVSRPGPQDTVNDKETRTKRGSRKASRNDELRSAAGPSTRREPRTRMSTSQHSEMNLHPPLILPGWDSQQPSPAMPRASHHTQHSLSPQAMHDAFGPGNWTTPMQNGLDLHAQFADQVMITPPPMPNVMPQTSYMDMALAHGSQNSFTGVPHPSQFHRPAVYHPDLHDGQHQSMRAPTPYEAFMGQPMQGHDVLGQRQYFM